MKKISVITVCLNNLAELKRTVESVLSQTYKDFEFVVVDGGSTDGCKEYIAGVGRIDRWVSERDSGVYNAMNKGARLATGEYILYLNSGDIFYNADVLKKVVPFLGEADFCVGNVEILKENGEFEMYDISPCRMSVAHICTYSIPHQATFVRSSVLKEKMFNEKHRLVSDWELFFEAWLIEGRSYKHFDLLVAKFYKGGISGNIELNEKERNEVYEKYINASAIARLHEDVSFKTKLENKINKAMGRSPLKRDVLLFKYALKYLFKDIISTLSMQ